MTKNIDAVQSRQPPILDELKDVRKLSYGHGTSSSQRKTSIQFNKKDQRKISMGYDKYVESNFVDNMKETDSKALLADAEATKRRLTILKNKKQKSKPEFRSNIHEWMYDFCESKLYTGFILSVILMNTGFLVAQTWTAVSVRVGWYCIAVDNVFLGIYIMEIVIKLYIWRKQFFRDGWNNLDFMIVIFGCLDFVLPLIMASMAGNNGATIFRLLRIFRGIRAIRALRVLRTIKFLNTLQVILTTLLQSIRSIGAIVALITLFMYMFAVVGRGLYADVDEKHFGNIFKALFTLFQLLTLDDWHEIYENVSKNHPDKSHIIGFLIVYIVVEYFIFLNLFVAVLVDNFQLTLDAQNELNKKKKKNIDDFSDDEEDEDEDGEDEKEDESSDEEDDVTQRKTAQQLYQNRCQPEQERIHRYFCLLAALESNNFILSNQQRLMDMMVDICNECASDNMFAKAEMQ